MGFVNYAIAPALPRVPDIPYSARPFNYPNMGHGSRPHQAPIATSTPSNSNEFSYNIPPSSKNPSGPSTSTNIEHKDLNVRFINVSKLILLYFSNNSLKY